MKTVKCAVAGCEAADDFRTAGELYPGAFSGGFEEGPANSAAQSEAGWRHAGGATLCPQHAHLRDVVAEDQGAHFQGRAAAMRAHTTEWDREHPLPQLPQGLRLSGVT